MTKTHASAELLAAMGDLLAAVRSAYLDFDTPSATGARTTRDEVADQLSDYILPRMVQLEAPLLTVIGGSTGAGKSTLVNSIVGSPVTEAGVLRPTTRSPVLVHHPDDEEWFSRDRILPDMPRVDEVDASSVYGLRLVATESVPSGLAILDAPDVDSIDQVNRELATQLLAAADLWLFVTSAARYADQVPWEYLKRAADRATSLAVVLDRTAPEAVEEVRGHLARMMTSRGLSDSPLFTVPESNLGPTGLIPTDLVAPIASWLHDLAADPRARRMVVGRTLDGAVRHIVLRAHDIADAIEEQIQVAATLHGSIDDAFDTARETTQQAASNASLVTGDLLVQWQNACRSPEFSRLVEDDVASQGRPAWVPGIAEARDAIGAVLASLTLGAADAAAAQVGEVWGATPAGRDRLESQLSVDRASSQTRVRAEQLGDAWLTAVAGLVRTVLAGSESTEFDLDTVATAVAIEALVVRGERPDPLPEVAGRLLERALADRTHDVVQAARTDLDDRIVEVLRIDRERLAAMAPSPEAVRAEEASLRKAARAGEYARHTDFVNGEIAP